MPIGWHQTGFCQVRGTCVVHQKNAGSDIESGTGQKTGNSSRALIWGGVGLLVIVIAIVGANLGSRTLVDGVPKPSASLSSPPDVGQLPITSVDVSQIPKNVVELGTFEGLTPKQQGLIQALEKMDIATFRSQPEDQQLMFAQFVYDNNLPIAVYRLDQIGRSDVYQTANLDTPEGILASENLLVAVLSTLKTASEDKGIAFDSLTARKLVVLSTTNEDIGTQRTEGFDGIIATWNVNTPSVIPSYVFAGSRTMANGDVVINGHDTVGGHDAQTTYRSLEFTTITGQTAKIDRSILSVNTSDSRYDPTVGQ